MGVGNPFISNAYGGNYTGIFILVNRKWGFSGMNVLGNSRKRGVGYGADIGLREGIQPKKGIYWVFRLLSFKAASFSCPQVFGRLAPLNMGCFEIEINK